jgi:hypothetical protein
MINLAPHDAWQAATRGAGTQRTENPHRSTAPLPRNGTLEPLQRTRPPAPPAQSSGASRSHADLPPELLCRVAERLKDSRDVRHYAQVNRETNRALAGLKDLRQLRWSQQTDHQLHLMTQGRQARTPEALLAIVQQIPALDGRLHAEPLEVAGHQLGTVAGRHPGEAAAAVFRAVWQATAALPLRLLPKPLFAIARQVAALPLQERLAAMEDALAQMRRLPMDASRHRTTHEWAHLLPKLPAQHAALGLQHLLDEARQFSPDQRRDLVQLLQCVESRVPLSPEESEEAHAAMTALQDTAGVFA